MTSSQVQSVCRLKTSLRRLGLLVLIGVAALRACWPLLAQEQLSPADKLAQICREAQKQEIPANLLPSEEQFIQAKSCSPLDVYYSQDADRFRQARICAVAITKRADRPGGSFDAELVLMMLFANGEGVPRSSSLARRFVCEFHAGGFDPQAVLQVIDSKRKLDFCTASEGYGRTPDFYCTQMNQGRVDASLQEESVRAKKTLPPAVWATWNILDHARMAYFAARQAEHSQGTAGIALFNMDLNQAADAGWLEYLRDIAGGTPPKGVLEASDFKAADQELNSMYKHAMESAAMNCNPYTPCPDAIRTAERAWIQYRDAWVGLAAVRWPQIAADKWLSWLTRARIEELGDL